MKTKTNQELVVIAKAALTHARLDGLSSEDVLKFARECERAVKELRRRNASHLL